MLYSEATKLIFRYDDHTLWIQPWGPNAFRVRATKLSHMPDEDWALSEPITDTSNETTISTTEDGPAVISNGKLSASVSQRGKIIMHSVVTGQNILEEYARHRLDLTDPKCSALSIEARELRGNLGGDDFHATYRLESVDPDEKIYGMGQYQQPYLNLKGTDLELAQRNSQACVPFAVSSLGYGLLWNNPGVGRAVLGRNVMSFENYATKSIDYWIVAGDTPAEIVEAYASVTGKVPMMPEYGLGFWQCKLRYDTQEKLLNVAREYKRREIPLDLIVIDFFHWVHQGEWSFDPSCFPDPAAMVAELKAMNVELMVSIWPTVEPASTNYDHMLEHGLLIRHDRGVRVAMEINASVTHFDATNPAARAFIWQQVKKNYYDLGIKVFWLDEAEPEFSIYDFDIIRYHAGPNLRVGNTYPLEYARAFYEGQSAAGQKQIVNLLRCAWAGSQKYGALVWSGDIASSWKAFRDQLAAGLNMGMAGIPWWTTDIGGFHGGNPKDPEFQELFARWFQWGAFCPVMRLHGDREPKEGKDSAPGADNEVWSYGEEVYGICKKYIGMREGMRDYTRALMKKAHEKGTPVMRTLFFEFPKDERAWEVETEYMFGDKYLVSPVLKAQQRKIKVYLPKGAKWKAWESEEKYEGGQTIEVECPIEWMPVFVRSE